MYVVAAVIETFFHKPATVIDGFEEASELNIHTRGNRIILSDESDGAKSQEQPPEQPSSSDLIQNERNKFATRDRMTNYRSQRTLSSESFGEKGWCS